MTTAGILLRNESIKTFRRLAFLVTAGAFGAINAIGFGQQFLRARSDPERSFALPDAWGSILSDPVQVAMLFGATVLILLIGSEYSWKTARQNVIDGLSKNQWFAGKLLLLPIVAVVFLGMLVLVGGTLAYAGSPAGAPLMTAGHARMLGAAALGVLGLGSIALFFAVLARSGGPALGMFFLSITLLEQIVGALLRQVRPAWGWVTRWFPGRHFMDLSSASNWDAAAYASAVRRAAENGATPPAPPADPLALVLVSFGWMLFFVSAAWLIYRSRDL